MALITLRQLVAKYFPANEVDNALAIIQLESGGDPNALAVVKNPKPGFSAEDSRGLFQINTLAHGTQEDFFNPEVNVRKAAEIWKARGGRWNLDWKLAADKLGLNAPGKKVNPNQAIGSTVIDTANNYSSATGGYKSMETPPNKGRTQQPKGVTGRNFIQWAIETGLLDADPTTYKGMGISYPDLVKYLQEAWGDEYSRQEGISGIDTGPSFTGPEGEGLGGDEITDKAKSLLQGFTGGMVGGVSNAINMAWQSITGGNKPPATEPGYAEFAASGDVGSIPPGVNLATPTSGYGDQGALQAATIQAAAKVKAQGGVVTIEDITNTASVKGAQRARNDLLASMSQIRTSLVQDFTASGDFVDPEKAADDQIKALLSSLNDDIQFEQSKKLALFQNSLKTMTPVDKTMNEYEAAMIGIQQGRLALDAAQALWDRTNMTPAQAAAAKTSEGRLALDTRQFEELSAAEKAKYALDTRKFDELTAAEKAQLSENQASLEEQRRHAQEVEALNRQQLDFQREQERQRIREALAQASMNAITNLTTARQRANEAYAKASEYALAPGQQYALGRGPGGLGERLGLELIDRSKTTPFNAFNGIPAFKSELERILAALGAA